VAVTVECGDHIDWLILAGGVTMGLHALRGLMAAVLVTVVAVSCSPSKATDDGSFTDASSNGAEPGSMFESVFDDEGKLRPDIPLDWAHFSALTPESWLKEFDLRRFNELSIESISSTLLRLRAHSMSEAMTRKVLNRLAMLYTIDELTITRSGRFAPGSWDLDCTIAEPVIFMSTQAKEPTSHPNEGDKGIMPGGGGSAPGGHWQSMGKFEYNSQDGDAWHCAWAILSQLDGIGGDAGFWLDSLVAKRGKQETKYTVQLRLADRRNAEVEEIMLKSRFAGSTVEMHQGNDGKGSVALTVGGTVSPIGERTMLSSKVALKGSLVLPETSWSPAGASTATPMPRDNDREHREWKSRQGK